MKYFPSYRSFLNSIVYLLLAGQVWANIDSYSDGMANTQFQAIELIGMENISFAEEDLGKELDEKFRAIPFIPELGIQKPPIQYLFSDSFLSLHDPEVTTPPPELTLFLS